MREPNDKICEQCEGKGWRKEYSLEVSEHVGTGSYQTTMVNKNLNVPGGFCVPCMACGGEGHFKR